jgi:hypothetical protein
MVNESIFSEQEYTVFILGFKVHTDHGSGDVTTRGLVDSPKHGGSRFLHNMDVCRQNKMASRPTRP